MNPAVRCTEKKTIIKITINPRAEKDDYYILSLEELVVLQRFHSRHNRLNTPRHGCQNDSSPVTPVSLCPWEPDSGVNPAEMPQLRHAEEDPLASGDPPPLQTRQALRLSAGTGEDGSNRCARWSVLLSSDRQEDKKKKKTGG